MSGALRGKFRSGIELNMPDCDHSVNFEANVGLLIFMRSLKYTITVRISITNNIVGAITLKNYTTLSRLLPMQC